ncbi:MAG: preprotein translocase subunit SecE [Clostridiales bacterium]|jgi:preprotein translocase subunit SecE|nr:preprotein translocase subunit SecE [Clostridiales bacterium]
MANNAKEKKPGLGKYLKSVRSEIKKVTWPTREDVLNYTAVVLVMVFVAAIAIGVMDTVFKFLFNLFA